MSSLSTMNDTFSVKRQAPNKGWIEVLQQWTEWKLWPTVCFLFLSDMWLLTDRWTQFWNKRTEEQSSLTFGLSVKSIRTCHVCHSVIQPVQNWRSGRGHLITAWFSCVVHFLLRVFPPLPLPAPLQHLTPPTDQLIKKQRFLVIKAVGYPDKISPSFILSDSSAGCTRGEREGCLQKWGWVTFICSQTNSSSRWQPEELKPVWGGK